MSDAERACSRDGAEPVETAPFPIPAELKERFQGLESFAQSPHSASYLATQPGGGFRGLLKIIPLRDLDASERGRLKRELRKQVKLAHPNLPRIVDGGELATDLWLLRDHVDGESLGQRLHRQGPLEPQEAMAVLAQVASALDELHRAGILHRDVRPSRIVLSPRDSVPIVKLLDAGIAARQRTGTAFDRLGTPAYMSPEQIAGKLVSFRSDLYALGCVFFEMLSGAPPFGRGESPDKLRALLDAHQNDPLPASPVELPAAVASLLCSLLDKEPRKRPFSAQQVRRTLEPHLPPGMPVVTPGRSSVAGAPSPTMAAGGSRRASAPARPSSPPGVLPPMRGSRPGSGPVAPAEEVTVTDELELVEAQPSVAPGGFREAHTLDIPAEELASLRIDPSLAPPPAGPEPESADSQRVEPQLEEPATTRVEPSHAQAMLDTPGDTEPEEPATASMPAPPTAAPEPAAAAAASRRPSVAFDVESLFNDPQEDPPPIVTAPASAAVPIATGPGNTPSADEAAPTMLYTKADGAAARAVYDRARSEQAEPSAAQDRTVVTRMPSAGGGLGRNKLIAGASGLAAVILLFAVCQGGEDEPPAAEAAKATDHAGAPPDEHVAKPEGAKGTTAAAAPSGAPSARPSEERAEAEETVAADERAAAAAEQQKILAEGDSAEPPAEQATAIAPGGDTTNTATAPSKPDDDRAASPARRNAPDAVVGQRASRSERVARAEKHKLEARAHYQAGRYKEAARAYELATRETPSDGGAFAGLGASLLASNQPDASIRAYQRAVQIDGKSSGFHAALGRAYAMKGDRARAKVAYQKALALNPKNGAALQGLERIK